MVIQVFEMIQTGLLPYKFDYKKQFLMIVIVSSLLTPFDLSTRTCGEGLFLD